MQADEYVWLMYVGIVGVESDSFIKFQNTPSGGLLCPATVAKFNSHSKLLFLFQCYLEAKQFPQNLFSIFKDGNIFIEHEELQPYDVISLINFIIKSDAQFKSLVLSYCQITDEGMHILSEFFNDHTEKISSIEYVSVDHNHITSLWGTLHSGSTDNHRPFVIPCFDLSCNVLRDTGISSALCYDTNLVELDVSDNGISDVGAVAISDCLKINCTLQELSVSNNRISDDGIKAISDSNNSLRALDISCICITATGTKEIAGALKSNKMLAYLNLSGNGILDDGVSIISDSIKQNSTLCKFDIASNTITNKGAIEIADLLKSHTVLSYLNISRNWIDKEGIMNILIASKSSMALQTLECIFNTLSQCDFIEIIDYVRKDNAIKTLNASWNWISCGKDGSSKINTTMCYAEGNDVESCEHFEHTTSPYYCNDDEDDVNFKFLDDVLYCCVKDSFVKELCLSSWLMTITAEALQINKSLASIHVTRSHINVNGALAINKCLKVNTLKELIISKSDLTDQALQRIVDTIACNKCTGLR